MRAGDGEHGDGAGRASVGLPPPPGLRLALDVSARRPSPGILVGGAPVRVLRLSSRGSSQVDAWDAGEPVGCATGAGALARRLLEAGLANPRPAGCSHPGEGDVTYVIPVRDRPDGLAATVTAVGDGPVVVVVDDGSADEHATLAAAGGATVVRHSSSAGPAAARNSGWRRAETSVVVFVDADCVPEAGWLQPLLAHLADPAVGAVAPRVVSTDPPGLPARRLGHYERVRSRLDLGIREGVIRPGSRVSYAPTAALVVRRTALEAVGGFDEDLRTGEDVDLVWRLVRGGWMVRYEPSSSVRHPRRSSTLSWVAQRYTYGLSAAPLAARHGRAVAPLAGSPWSAAVWALLLAGHPFVSAAVGVGTTGALVRRAGGDRGAARVLAGLAVKGHALTGLGLARAVRQAWLPPAIVVAAACSGRSRARVVGGLAAAFVLEPLGEWCTKRPEGIGPLSWIGLRAADDLAYQAGVWVGAWRARSVGALLPRW